MRGSDKDESSTSNLTRRVSKRQFSGSDDKDSTKFAKHNSNESDNKEIDKTMLVDSEELVRSNTDIVMSDNRKSNSNSDNRPRKLTENTKKKPPKLEEFVLQYEQGKKILVEYYKYKAELLGEPYPYEPKKLAQFLVENKEGKKILLAYTDIIGKNRLKKINNELSEYSRNEEGSETGFSLTKLSSDAYHGDNEDNVSDDRKTVLNQNNVSKEGSISNETQKSKIGFETENSELKNRINALILTNEKLKIQLNIEKNEKQNIQVENLYLTRKNNDLMKQKNDLVGGNIEISAESEVPTMKASKAVVAEGFDVVAKYDEKSNQIKVDVFNRPNTSLGITQGDHVSTFSSFLTAMSVVVAGKDAKEAAKFFMELAINLMPDQQEVFKKKYEEIANKAQKFLSQKDRKNVTALFGKFEKSLDPRDGHEGDSEYNDKDPKKEKAKLIIDQDKLKYSLKVAERQNSLNAIQEMGSLLLTELNKGVTITFPKASEKDSSEGSRVNSTQQSLVIIDTILNESFDVDEFKESCLITKSPNKTGMNNILREAFLQYYKNWDKANDGNKKNIIKKVAEAFYLKEENVKNCFSKTKEEVVTNVADQSFLDNNRDILIRPLFESVDKQFKSDEKAKEFLNKTTDGNKRGGKFFAAIKECYGSDKIANLFGDLFDFSYEKVNNIKSSDNHKKGNSLEKYGLSKTKNIDPEDIETLFKITARHLVIMFSGKPDLYKKSDEKKEIIDKFLQDSVLKESGWNKASVTEGSVVKNLDLETLKKGIEKYSDFSKEMPRMRSELERVVYTQFREELDNNKIDEIAKNSFGLYHLKHKYHKAEENEDFKKLIKLSEFPKFEELSINLSKYLVETFEMMPTGFDKDKREIIINKFLSHGLEELKPGEKKITTAGGIQDVTIDDLKKRVEVYCNLDGERPKMKSEEQIKQGLKELLESTKVTIKNLS